MFQNHFHILFFTKLSSVYISHLLLFFPQKTQRGLAGKCRYDLCYGRSQGAEDEYEVPRSWYHSAGLSQRIGYVCSFSLFFPPGSRKHQRQTWVGSKCSLKKPTTLRNGRPNSKPWWRVKTKFGTRARIHFPGMECLRQLPLSNDSVLNSSILKLQQTTKIDR